MTPMSSLGRFLPIVASSSANFAVKMPGSAGGSSGVECTVAIPDYRLLGLDRLWARGGRYGFRLALLCEDDLWPVNLSPRPPARLREPSAARDPSRLFPEGRPTGCGTAMSGYTVPTS